MKKLSLIILSIFLITYVSAQKEKIYYNKDWKVVKSKRDASFYRIVTFDKEGKPKGIIRDYYITKELQWEGSMSYMDKYDNKKDTINGLATYYYKNGRKSSQMTYVNNKIEGKVIRWDKKGNKESEQNYKNGILNGISIWYYSNGLKDVEANFINGKEDGIVTTWFENGSKKSEMNFKNGVRHGLTTHYSENGKKESEITFFDDKVNGISKIFFENGNVRIEGNSKNGKRNGSWIEYFENGNVKFEKNYENDKLNGSRIEYSESGKIKDKQKYENGILNGNTIKYNNKGKPEVEIMFENGEVIGFPKHYMYNKDGSFSTFMGTLDANAKMTGKHKFYNSTGVLIDEFSSKDGKIYGFRYKLEDGISKQTLSDNFVNNFNDWSLYDNDRRVSYIENGLHFKYKTSDFNGTYVQSILTGSRVDFNKNNFIITTSFIPNDGKYFGVKFGLTNDLKTYFVFQLLSNGMVCIEKVIDGIRLAYSGPYKKAHYFTPNSENILTIKKYNNKIFFALNGEVEYIMDNEYIKGKLVSLVSNSGHVVYKSFEIVLEDVKPIVEHEFKGNGSGFFIDKNGYIVTNYHVVSEADGLIVEFFQNGEKKSYKAQIIQSDKQNDISIIKIIDKNFIPLPPLPYKLKTQITDVATDVFTLGFPMALSGLGEEVKFTDGKISSKTGFQGNISTYQISVPVQPGNSGGPLFDSKGNLIGIVNAKVMEADNVSYAIKSSYLKSLLDVVDEKITTPSYNTISDLSLTEKIKVLSDYVVLIKIK